MVEDVADGRRTGVDCTVGEEFEVFQKAVGNVM